MGKRKNNRAFTKKEFGEILVEGSIPAFEMMGEGHYFLVYRTYPKPSGERGMEFLTREEVEKKMKKEEKDGN